MNTASPSYHPNPSKPDWDLPSGACDTHCHVFGPVGQFPYAPDRTYTPASDAPREALFALHEHLGIDRCVIVQAGCHGFDNSVVEAAIRAGAPNYLGIALMPVDTPIAKLREMRDAGFRGVRFNFMRHLGAGAPPEDVRKFCSHLAEADMHLQIHMEAELLGEVLPIFDDVAIPVVVDHIGRVDAGKGIQDRDFGHLLRFMEKEHSWVKVSGCDRISAQQTGYDDAISFAAKLVHDFPDRSLWGTDWPHPNISKPVPDDGYLVSIIQRFAPSPESQKALLVDNPTRLYAFN
jgi:2-pyrone-4,6-dicarboxylate lactonase